MLPLDFDTRIPVEHLTLRHTVFKVRSIESDFANCVAWLDRNKKNANVVRFLISELTPAIASPATK
jgi:hypothetical protein